MPGAPCHPRLTLYGQASPSRLREALPSPHRRAAAGLERSTHRSPGGFLSPSPTKWQAAEAGGAETYPLLLRLVRGCGSRQAAAGTGCRSSLRPEPLLFLLLLLRAAARSVPRLAVVPRPGDTHNSKEGCLAKSGRVSRRAGRRQAAFKVSPLPEPPPWVSARRCQGLKLGN